MEEDTEPPVFLQAGHEFLIPLQRVTSDATSSPREARPESRHQANGARIDREPIGSDPMKSLPRFDQSSATSPPRGSGFTVKLCE